MARTAITRRSGGGNIRNASFEIIPSGSTPTTAVGGVSVWIDGTSGGSTTNDAYGWRIFRGAVTTASQGLIDNSVYYSGTGSLKLLNTSTSATTYANCTSFQAGGTFVSKYAAILKPSTVYTYSFMVKTNNVVANAAYGRVIQYDAAGVVGTTITTSKLGAGSEDWQLISKTFTSDADAAYAQVELNNGAAGNVSDVWFDDIQLVATRTTAATRTGMVKNGNFENAPTFVAATNTNLRWIDGTAGGSTNNDVYGWAITNRTGGTAQFDNTQSRSGSNAIKLSVTDNTTYIFVAHEVESRDASPATKLSHLIPVKPNTPYNISYWLKVANVSSTGGSAKIVMECQEHSSTGAITVGTANVGTAVTANQDWTYYSKVQTTNASTSFLKLTLINYRVAGDAWFDDITLQQTSRSAVA